jgi:hypothetical protein
MQSAKHPSQLASISSNKSLAMVVTSKKLKVWFEGKGCYPFLYMPGYTAPVVMLYRVHTTGLNDLVVSV